MDKLLNVFNQLADSDLVESLSNLFHLMDIANEEIKKAQERFPEKADEIFASFKKLYPEQELLRHPRVYRHHCQEALEQIANGKKIRTKAQMLCALSKMSINQKISHEAIITMKYIFSEIFPENAMELSKSEIEIALEHIRKFQD